MKFIGAGHGRTEIDMRRDFDRKIVLEDGAEYYGYGFGDTEVQSVCEIVFNTSMVGYQEIVSDPSYTYQTGRHDISAHRQLRHRRTKIIETETPTIGGLDRARIQRQPFKFPLYENAFRDTGGKPYSRHLRS